MESKAEKIVTGAKMPAGEYVVGDPCYAVPSERWMEWLEAADYLNEPQVLLAELDGLPILGISTAHGDGCYRGSDGNRYPVDAGIIGLVPTALAGVTEEQEKYGSGKSPVVTFDRDFTCSYDEDGGVIRLGNIKIETDEDDYDEDDE